VPPAQPPSRQEHERAHRRTGRPHALAHGVARGGGEPPRAEIGSALESHLSGAEACRLEEGASASEDPFRRHLADLIVDDMVY
jgi:hypothetical protein